MHYQNTKRGQEEFKTTRLKKSFLYPMSYVNLEKRTLEV